MILFSEISVKNRKANEARGCNKMDEASCINIKEKWKGCLIIKFICDLVKCIILKYKLGFLN